MKFLLFSTLSCLCSLAASVPTVDANSQAINAATNLDNAQEGTSTQILPDTLNKRADAIEKNSAKKDTESVNANENSNEKIAAWLVNSEGIPNDMVQNALSQDGVETSSFNKRSDNKRESESTDANESKSQKKEDQEVAEESADENALESNDADDINSQSDTQTNTIQKRGLGVDDSLGLDGHHFGHRHGCLNCLRRTTVIHRFRCIRRFVPRVFVAHIFRTGCGGCGGFRRRVCVGKLILIDRGCRVDVFVKFTQRPHFTRFPFLIRPRCGCRGGITTPIFLKHGIDGGAFGFRRFGRGFGRGFGRLFGRRFGHRFGILGGGGGLDLGFDGNFGHLGNYHIGRLHKVCENDF